VALQQAFQAFDASDQRVAILSAMGDRAFTSGADVTDLPELWRAIPGVGFRTDKPVIAATSGSCVEGGVVMVMMCDPKVSTEDTVFYYPEAKLGVTAGMISSLVSRMPHKLAMEIMLLASKVSARRATRWASSTAWCRTASTRPRRWRWQRSCWTPRRW
jgi:enoyl-CoA hydratase